jgi:two-component system, LytTR family, sensor histidine kinase AlgZ
MHPFVSRPRQLLLYVVLWIPLTALLVYLFRASGLSAQEAGMLLWLLAPIYALLCLLAWYPCKATPLQTAGTVRIIVTHSVAATLISGLWMLLAILYVSGLVLLQPFRGLSRYPDLYKLIFVTGVLIYLLWVASYYVVLSLETSRQAEQRLVEARVLARDSELRALKAQINPHFIFNSLHSISALTSINPAKAREMCISLADFLRATLGMGEKTLIPLSEELELVHRYLEVEKVRFGARLTLEETIDDAALSCVIPPLLLQPLVENAIVHGIAHLPEGGWIRMNARETDGRLTLSVENNFDPEFKSRRRSGIGLANVRERVEVRYGDTASFLAGPDGERFRVEISLPVERSNTA